MGRTNSRLERDVVPLWEAEGRAVRYLWDKPPELAAAIAAKVAKRLLRKWELERQELIRADDPRKVFIATHQESLGNLHAELDRIIARRSPSDPNVEERVISLVENLPTDVPADDAAWVAITVARLFEARAPLNQQITLTSPQRGKIAPSLQWPPATRNPPSATM